MSISIDIFPFGIDIFPNRAIGVFNKLRFDSCFIVKQDIPVKCVPEFIKCRIGIHQRKLRFHMTEERFDPGIIKAVAGTGHALDDSVLFQISRIGLAPKLTALI